MQGKQKMEKGKEPKKTMSQVKSSLSLVHRECALEHKFHYRQGDCLLIFPVSRWLAGGP